ncbi:hypothetical protein LEP1GSC082_0069 [Leptospira kirschneri str. H2]|uniref:Uncharacterized protein n=2 Tax=Leptospira kirschneri TaxID=29507 RepID=A0A0E2BBA7_9LEPT|nr:hypothetical protein LEP1GSC081_0915 [Leptospira kirschneri str. H1]EKO59036.1 hypothetical protein LEP1GSC082_0069 [Leptospira kirschneri str. H2]EMK23470.1 hypothetical protein LEP1GSC008_4134 [Leptospira kirschneri serovar Bulgarica str. Nikolaevo]
MSLFLSSKENLRLVFWRLSNSGFVLQESIHNFLHSKSTNSA